MAGSSAVTYGILAQSLSQLDKAGMEDWFYERIAKDKENLLAQGVVSLMLAQRWLEERVVKLSEPGIAYVSIPGTKVRYRVKNGSAHSYERQWYGVASDTQDKDFTFHSEYDDQVNLASKTPFEQFKLIPDEWTPFIPDWEALGLYDQPQMFIVRRIPRPRWWVKLAPGWEAHFTQDRETGERNFALRPYLKVFP